MIRQPRRWPWYAAAVIGVVFVFKYPVLAADLIKGTAHAVEWCAAQAHAFFSVFR
jgi:hypothetical protein